MIETERLRLRPWLGADRAAFGALVNTPAMMGALGGMKTEADIDAMFQRRLDDQAAHGHSYWAAELKTTDELVGSCGIRIASNHVDTPVHDLPEIGWRIAQPHWRKGYALEAARAAMAWGWANLDIRLIWAGTSIENEPSWRLMERLGMKRRHALDFRNRFYPAEDPASATIVYVIERPQ